MPAVKMTVPPPVFDARPIISGFMTPLLGVAVFLETIWGLSPMICALLTFCSASFREITKFFSSTKRQCSFDKGLIRRINSVLLKAWLCCEYDRVIVYVKVTATDD